MINFRSSNKLAIIALAIAIPVLAVIYFVFDPSTGVLFPKCPFLLATGYPCAGCGSQRAIHSLLHLDIVAAFRYNAMLVIMLPMLFIIVGSKLTRKRFPKIYRYTHHHILAYIILSAILLWWVLRIIFHWYI